MSGPCKVLFFLPPPFSCCVPACFPWHHSYRLSVRKPTHLALWSWLLTPGTGDSFSFTDLALTPAVPDSRDKKRHPPHPIPKVAMCPPRDKGHLCVRDRIQTQGWRVKDAGLQNLKQGWARPRELCGSNPGVGKLASRPNLACHLFL